MIAPEVLLKMYPLDALRAQIGEVLKSPLKATHLRIDAPESLGGTRTRVSVSLDKSLAPVELWKLVGTFDFEYDRLDLGSFTQGIAKSLRSTLPAEAYRVLGSLLQPYQIPVIDSDLVASQFMAVGPVSLLAHPASYRWVGEMTATLWPALYNIDPVLKHRLYVPVFDHGYRSADFKRLLTQYLNLANSRYLPVTLTSGMYTYGTPVANDLPEMANNTRLTLTFSGSPYQGTVDVHYTRRSFPKTFRTPLKMSGSQFANIKRLNGPLSTALGCVIAEADIASQTVPIPVGQTKLFALPFASTSLCYVGEVWIEYTRTL